MGWDEGQGESAPPGEGDKVAASQGPGSRRVALGPVLPPSSTPPRSSCPRPTHRVVCSAPAARQLVSAWTPPSCAAGTKWRDPRAGQLARWRPVSSRNWRALFCACPHDQIPRVINAGCMKWATKAACNSCDTVQAVTKSDDEGTSLWLAVDPQGWV